MLFRHPPEKGEKGRKRAKKADFGRFPGRAARHLLNLFNLLRNTPICEPLQAQIGRVKPAFSAYLHEIFSYFAFGPGGFGVYFAGRGVLFFSCGAQEIAAALSQILRSRFRFRKKIFPLPWCNSADS